jgi:hypothetical protein
MRRYILCAMILLPAIFIFTLAGCGGKTHTANWNESKIQVDGNPDDWSAYPLEVYEHDNIQMVLGLVNNDTSLDIMLKFNDARLARIFNRRGVTLWLNGADKKDKVLGIRYVDKNARFMEMPPSGEFGEPSNRILHDNKEILPNGTFFFIHKGDTIDLPVSGFDSYSAAAGYKKSAYCFEFGIPLAKAEESNNALKISKNGKIKLGIEISPVSEAQKKKQEMMGEKGTGRPGGFDGGGMPGGGMRGGGMPGGMRGNPSFMNPNLDGQEMWMNVQLAGSPGTEEK